MNRSFFVLSICFLFIASLLLNVILYDFWKQEKKAHALVKTELQRTNETLKTIQSNSPERIKRIAEDFSKTLFSYDKLRVNERESHLKSLVSPELATQLSTPSDDKNTEPLTIQNDNISSQAVIKDSVYNQTGDDTAKVIVTIEQTLQAGNIQSKTIQVIQVNVKYNEKSGK